MRFSGIRIWSQAVSFFFRHLVVLTLLAPLLLVPFLSDGLSAALVAQERREGRLHPAVALRQTLRALPALVRLKLYYYARALGWGLIPIYGIIRDIDERLAWAMSSNVTVLEGRTDFSGGTVRCRELVSEFRGKCIRVLITIPALLVLSLTVMLALTAMLALGASSWAFWATVGAFIWLWLPGAAAANTYLYLWIRQQEAEASPDNIEATSSPNQRVESTGFSRSALRERQRVGDSRARR